MSCYNELFLAIINYYYLIIVTKLSRFIPIESPFLFQ